MCPEGSAVRDALEFGVVVPMKVGPISLGVEVVGFMSYLLFDFLLPLVGPAAAEYWAQLLVVGPL